MDWLCWVREVITEAAMKERRVDLKNMREMHTLGPMQKPVERER